MHLIEGFTNRHAAFFKLHLHQRQAIDQDRHIVAVGVAARLLKLLDHLHLIAGNILFIQQVDVLNMAIVKHKIMDIVIMNLARFVDDAVAGPVQIGFNKALPLALKKPHIVQGLQLLTHIGQQLLRRV